MAMIFGEDFLDIFEWVKIKIDNVALQGVKSMKNSMTKSSSQIGKSVVFCSVDGNFKRKSTHSGITKTRGSRESHGNDIW